MISESHPWREELCSVADRLEACKAGVDWRDEYAAFRIERDVMFGAYAVRKLFEAHKLADSLAGSTVRVGSYPLIDRVPDYMNWYRLDDFYDFSRREAQTLTITQFCNQFIHSFIWLIESEGMETDATDATGLIGCFVASDTLRSRSLYQVSVDVLINLFRSVGSEEVVSTQMTRDASGQWEISNLAAQEAIEPP